MKPKPLLFLISILILGFLVRLYYLLPDHVILGYDQMVDLYSARKIINYKDFIVQELETNSLGINHGVLMSYYTALFYWIGKGDVIIISLGYIFLNMLSVITIYLFILIVFENIYFATISAVIFVFSPQLILMSGWISLTVPGLVFIPTFYLGFWLYSKKKNFGLYLSAISLGILIQSQLLMVYQFITIPIIFYGLKLKIPKIKTIFLSLFGFLSVISTIIIAEIRTNYSTLRLFLNPAGNLDESSKPFFQNFNLLWNQYIQIISRSIFPDAGVFIILFAIYFAFRFWIIKKRSLFLLLIFIISPTFMLLVGYHNQPWSLMGAYPAAVILTAFILFRFPIKLISNIILMLLIIFNINQVVKLKNNKILFIPQEESSTLSGKLDVLKYTYNEARGKPFAINSVNYPLYRDLYWSYMYPIYGLKNYGYLPFWLGGDQLYPCNTLNKGTGDDMIFFMIVDETRAIPEIYKKAGRKWGTAVGKLIDEKVIGGFTVQKYRID